VELGDEPFDTDAQPRCIEGMTELNKYILCERDPEPIRFLVTSRNHRGHAKNFSVSKICGPRSTFYKRSMKSQTISSDDYVKLNGYDSLMPAKLDRLVPYHRIHKRPLLLRIFAF